MPYDINETHDPNLKSWVESANDPETDFPIQNLPFCAFGDRDERGYGLNECGVRIGDSIFRMREAGDAGLFDGILDDEGNPFDAALMSQFPDLSPRCLSELRARISQLLRFDSRSLQSSALVSDRVVVQARDVVIGIQDHLVGNYTDFYASIHHASTVGSMFRPDAALLPNYKWVPIGYHGRASSIVVSGTEIRRPRGQTKQDDAPGAPITPPTFGPCKMLDYEMEVGCFIGRGNDLGTSIPIEDAEDHIFGLCLVNDWSARDLQKWEYQPLGPFLAKNFATSVSPYIVTMEALAPFRIPAYVRPVGDPAPLPYLCSERNQARGGFDITLEVSLASRQMRERGLSPVRLSRGSFKDMYWTFAQLVTHHASNGCNLRSGDLLASGTVSGERPDSRGCLLELTWQGRDAAGKPQPRKPIDLPTGERRLYLEDGDEVIMKGFCEREGYRRIGFGECRGVIAPAE